MVYCSVVRCLVSSFIVSSVVIVGFMLIRMLKVFFGSCLSVIIFSDIGMVFDMIVMFSLNSRIVGFSSVMLVCVMFIGIIISVVMYSFSDMVCLVCRWFVCLLKMMYIV